MIGWKLSDETLRWFAAICESTSAPQKTLVFKEFEMRRMPNKPSALVLTAIAGILLTGCSTTSSKPSGQLISERGGAISAKGEAWTDGQRDLQKGQKLVQRSDARVADGQNKLLHAQQAAADAERQIQTAQVDRTSGEQIMAGGATRMKQAEADYAAIRNGPSAIESRPN